ncbi:hypothetical protein C8A00DRAFT_18657 [Chaetomidium leptoderma]|uniref:LysM domain-containing protein n=1 Tax=Chaetomidium leptoderma TaxID=669021 RepID=A0AAN6VDX6_9PEZI|nr:hypothetical protein C8A00DRAFT_18657 [Chaetomidium leptoderma]
MKLIRDLSFGTFSESDFIAWNPSVLGDCHGLRTDTYYCIATPGTPTTRTEPLPTNTPGAGGSRPTQDGIAANCTKLWIVSPSDTCDSITSAARVSLTGLLAWNPALGKDCRGLEPDYAVCVSTRPRPAPSGSTVTVTGRPTKTKTTKPPPSSSSVSGSGGGGAISTATTA